MNWQKLLNLKDYAEVKRSLTLQDDATAIAKKLQKLLINNSDLPEGMRKELEEIAVDVANISKTSGVEDLFVAYRELQGSMSHLVDYVILAAGNIKYYNNREDLSAQSKKQIFDNASESLLQNIYSPNHLRSVMHDIGMSDEKRKKILTDVVGEWGDIVVRILPSRSASFNVCLGAEVQDKKGLYLFTDHDGNFEKIFIQKDEHYLELSIKKWTMIRSGCAEQTISDTWYIREGIIGAVPRINGFDFSLLTDVVNDPFNLTEQDAALIELAFPDLRWDTSLFDDFRGVVQELRHG